MKQYREYLIEAYGPKEAERKLQNQYFFDLKTTKAIRAYKSKALANKPYGANATRKDK